MAYHIYDIIIIGGGPAGYTSGIYASRAGFDTLVIEKFSAGGQMTQTLQIENYPGFEDGIDGFTLGAKMKRTAERFGTKTHQAEVIGVDLTGEIKSVKTQSTTFYAKSVIISIGAEHKHLGLKDEEALVGKGIAYCAACDGMFFKGKTVAVVGGGNSAAADALLLSKICKKVYVIHRRSALTAEKFYQIPLFQMPNVEFIWNSKVKSFIFDNKLKGITITSTDESFEQNIDLCGVFISIGRLPKTKLFENQISMDKNGYIIADESTRTNIPGVFAAGDVRTKPLRQIVTAVSDGATAVHFAEKYLTKAK